MSRYVVDGGTAVLTGAAGGIGGALARGFAAAGAKLVACDLNPRVHELAAQWRESGMNVESLAFDVTSEEEIAKAFEEVIALHGRLDVLINNAGQGRGGNLDTLTPEQILEHANVLQMGHFRFIQAVVPHMRRQRWGRIVEINAAAVAACVAAGATPAVAVTVGN